MHEPQPIDKKIATFTVLKGLSIEEESPYMQIQTLLAELRKELEYSEAEIDLLSLWNQCDTKDTDPAMVLDDFLLALTLLLKKLRSKEANQDPASVMLQTENVTAGRQFIRATALSEIKGVQDGKNSLIIDLATNPQQAIDIVSKNRVIDLSSTCIFSFVDPLKSQVPDNEQGLVLHNPEKAYGTVLHVHPGESIVFLSPDGSTKKYEQGTYAKQELPRNAICFINHGATKSEIFIVVIDQYNKAEFKQYPYLADPMFRKLEQEMFQFVGKSSHTESEMHSTLILHCLSDCMTAADYRKNVPIAKDAMWAALDSHPLLSEPSGRILKERWKDMLNGSLAGGWQASVRSQTIVNQLYAGEPQKITHTDVEAYYHAVYSSTKLEKLIASWKTTNKITEAEYEELRSEERYSFRGGSIWTLAEVALAELTNSEQKAAAHEQLVEYCYAIKATEKLKPSFSEFSTGIARLAESLPEIQNSLDSPMLWEYIHSEVTGDFSAVYSAMLDQLLIEIAKNETLTDEDKKDSHRTVTGKIIDTLRYNPEGEMAIIQCQLSDIVQPNSPLHYYLRARSQTADTVIEYHIPLASQPQLLEHFKRTSTTPTAIDQKAFEQQLATAQLAACLGGESASCAAFNSDGNSIMNEILDDMLQMAFKDEDIDLIGDSHEHTKYSADIIALLSYTTSKNGANSSETVTGLGEDQAQAVIEYLQAKNEWNQAAIRNILLQPKKQAVLIAQLQKYFSELNTANSTLATKNSRLKPVLQKLLDNWTQRNKNTIRRATNAQIAQLILSAKQVVMQHHGWGASSVGSHPFNEVAAKQEGMENTIFIACSHMGSSGTNEIKFANKKAVNLVKTANEQQQDFSTYASWNIQLAKILGVYSREQVTLLGHSMGGMIVLFSALLLPKELWEKTGILSVTPVATNNEQSVKLIDFIEILMANDQLRKAFESSEIWKNLIALGTHNGEFDMGLLRARARSEEHSDVKQHLGILEKDSTAPYAVSFAGLMTEMVTNGRIPGVLNSLVVTVGDKIYLNSLIYKQLVQHCDDRISAEHGHQLATFVQTFLVNVTNILHEARAFSVEEIAYLKTFIRKIKIMVATGDRVLKPQHTIVLLEELLDAFVIAHNSEKHEEGHYALGDLISNMLLGVEILVNFFDQAKSKQT